MTGTWDGRTSKPLGHSTCINTQKSLDDLFDDDFEEEFSTFLEQEASQLDAISRSQSSEVANPQRQQRCNDSGYPSDGHSNCSSRTTSKVSRVSSSPVSRYTEHHSDNVGEPAAASTPCTGLVAVPPARTLTYQTTPQSSATRAGSARKRKFPGPAGILPNTSHLGNDVSTLQNTSPDVLSKETSWPPTSGVSRVPRTGSDGGGGGSSSSVPCSQPSGSLCSYSDALWQRMMQDLQIREEELREHSIESVKRAAARKKLKGGKVPFLAAVIDSVSVAIADASVLLKDPTGDMHGTVLKQLIKDYPTQLRSGSLLLLRQVAVFSPSPRRQYLNITPNNVLCIYNDCDDVGTTVVTTVSQLGTVGGRGAGESSLKQAVNEAVACAPFVPALRVQPGRPLSAAPAKYASGYTPERLAAGILPVAASADRSIGRFGGCAASGSRSATDGRVANSGNRLPASVVTETASGRSADGNRRLADITDTERPIAGGTFSGRLVPHSAEPAKQATTPRLPGTTAVRRPALVTSTRSPPAKATSATSRAVQQAACRNPSNVDAAAASETGWLDCDWDDLDLELP